MSSRRRAVCDNPHCPERGVVITADPEPARPRCTVCAWLLRLLKDEPAETSS